MIKLFLKWFKYLQFKRNILINYFFICNKEFSNIKKKASRSLIPNKPAFTPFKLLNSIFKFHIQLLSTSCKRPFQFFNTSFYFTYVKWVKKFEFNEFKSLEFSIYWIPFFKTKTAFNFVFTRFNILLNSILNSINWKL